MSNSLAHQGELAREVTVGFEEVLGVLLVVVPIVGPISLVVRPSQPPGEISSM